MPGTWQITDNSGDPAAQLGLDHYISEKRIKEYKLARDVSRANAANPRPAHWGTLSMKMAAVVSGIKNMPQANIGRPNRFIYDKHDHGGNRAKDIDHSETEEIQQCPLCQTNGVRESQQHTILKCKHENLVTIRERMLHKCRENARSTHDTDQRKLAQLLIHTALTQKEGYNLFLGKWEPEIQAFFHKQSEVPLTNLPTKTANQYRSILVQTQRNLENTFYALWDERTRLLQKMNGYQDAPEQPSHNINGMKKRKRLNTHKITEFYQPLQHKTRNNPKTTIPTPHNESHPQLSTTSQATKINGLNMPTQHQTVSATSGPITLTYRRPSRPWDRNALQNELDNISSYEQCKTWLQSSTNTTIQLDLKSTDIHYGVITPDGLCAYNTTYTASQRPSLADPNTELSPERDHLQTRHNLLIPEERAYLTSYIEDRLDYLQSLTQPHTYDQLNQNIKEVLPSATRKTRRLLEWLNEPEFNHLIQYPKETPASTTASAEPNWPSARELLAIAHDEQLTVFVANEDLGHNHYKMEIETTQPEHESYFTIPIITQALQRCNLYTLKGGHFYPLPSTHYMRHLHTAIAKLTTNIYDIFQNTLVPVHEEASPNPPTPHQQDGQTRHRKHPEKLKSSTHTQTGMFQFLHDVIPLDPATTLIRIETSKLPNAGKGAFAKATIQHKSPGKPTTIAIYKPYTDNPTPAITYEQLTHPDYHTDYGYSDKDSNIALDPYDHSTKTPLCLAAYINDPLDPQKWNVAFKIIENQVTIITTKTIGKGQELYAPYGPTYWNDHKHPTTLIRKAMMAYNVFALDETWTETLKQAELRDQRESGPIQTRLHILPTKTTYNALTGKTKALRTKNNPIHKTTKPSPQTQPTKRTLEFQHHKRARDTTPTTNSSRYADQQKRKQPKQHAHESNTDGEISHGTPKPGTTHNSQHRTDTNTDHTTTKTQHEAPNNPAKGSMPPTSETPANTIATHTTAETPNHQRKRSRVEHEQQPDQGHTETTPNKRQRRKCKQNQGTRSITNFFHFTPQVTTTAAATEGQALKDDPANPPPEREGIG
jgi:hypothetical protein